MLKKGTLGLLLAAIALTGGVLFFENRDSSNSSQTAVNGDSDATAKLFPIEEEDIQQFSVVRQVVNESQTEEDSEANSDNENGETSESTATTAPETLTFAKQDDGTWQMTTPETAIAESGAIAFLLSQITSPTARLVTINEPEPDLSEFGLDQPNYTVTLTSNDKDYTLKVGGLDFAGDSRYVQTITDMVDVSTSDSESDAEAAPELIIYVVPGSILNAVERPTSEWLVATETDTESDNEPETTNNNEPEENQLEEKESEESSPPEAN